MPRHARIGSIVPVPSRALRGLLAILALSLGVCTGGHAATMTFDGVTNEQVLSSGYSEDGLELTGVDTAGSLVGRTFAGFNGGAAAIGTEIYRYLNFDRMPDFTAAAEQGKRIAVELKVA